MATEAANRNDLPAATAVFNLAALLASDCGRSDLAGEWCHRLARAALHHGCDGQLGLEPIVNLARLRTRAGDGPAAWSLLETLYHAIASRTDTVIDGVKIPIARLTGTPEAHRHLRSWMWAILLSTGTHALMAADRWDLARHQLARYKGIGQRMLDGRQIAVVAHVTAGNHTDAATLLDTTRPGERWENAVTACLTLLLSLSTNNKITVTRHSHAAVAAYRDLDSTIAGLAVFHTRLGLCLIDALSATDSGAMPPLADVVIQLAVADGYAARDVLTHPLCRDTATPQQVRYLENLVGSCGLGLGTMPEPLLAGLLDVLDIAERVIALARPRRAWPCVERAPSREPEALRRYNPDHQIPPDASEAEA